MEENHAFQNIPAIKRNHSPIPAIASLPNTPSKSSLIAHQQLGKL